MVGCAWGWLQRVPSRIPVTECSVSCVCGVRLMATDYSFTSGFQEEQALSVISDNCTRICGYLRIRRLTENVYVINYQSTCLEGPL